MSGPSEEQTGRGTKHGTAAVGGVGKSPEKVRQPRTSVFEAMLDDSQPLHSLRRFHHFLWNRGVGPRQLPFQQKVRRAFQAPEMATRS